MLYDWSPIEYVPTIIWCSIVHKVELSLIIAEIPSYGDGLII